MSSNRMHLPDTIHFVTNRCEHEMFLLLPTNRITGIIQCWFARALCLYGQGLEIYAFIFLSNHWHLLCKDTKGTLAAFMCYFQANVAKAINRELGRRGKFWSREYDDVIVEGDDEFWDRYGYTVGNAVKAGLVDKSRDWIGWCSLDAALSNGKFSFEMMNRTKLHNATRRGQKVDPSQFIEKWSFELTPPPMMADKSAAEIKHKIKETLKSAEEEYRGLRENKPPLGVAMVSRQRPTDRPRNPSFRPRVRVFSLDNGRRKKLLDVRISDHREQRYRFIVNSDIGPS